MTIQSTPETKPRPDHAYILTHKTVGEIRGHFFVPSYQRGYRWDRNDVTCLLDDVWSSRGTDYNLQPIVVKLHKQREKPADCEWELIDGQQRLTTLYLLLQYMKEKVGSGLGAPYSLRYETRPGSQAYLNTLDKSSHDTNIDYYHLYRANRRIAAWFRRHGDNFQQNNAANKIHGYLFNSVRIIWYEAPDDVDATSLFTRLNVGRIPLTNAELIKAALLSAVRINSTDRAYEIAAQWDGIERDLHHTDIWAFVVGLAANNMDEKYPTRISLLLDTLADEKAKPAGKRPRYHTFDILQSEIEQNILAFWKKVIALHAQILGWYEQPNIYNKIGFLVASGMSIGELACEAKQKKKSEFEQFLVERIRSHVGVKATDLEDLSYEEKKRGYPKLLELLLLMNVEISTQSGVRFPFSRHIGQTWSLEHIHAQNAEALNKAEQWKTWLNTHQPALDALSENDKGEIEKLKTEMGQAIAEINTGKSGIFSGEKFNALSERVLKMLNHDATPDHSIRNMALLSSGDNSRLSNSVFEVKRQMILELDRTGKYVPACTRNVFLKYYAKADAQQPHFWSDQDKKSYLKAILDMLKPYLIQLA